MVSSSTPFQPSNAGTISDEMGRVRIGMVHQAYFSQEAPVVAFIEEGILPIERSLSTSIRLTDLGGGEGFLCERVAKILEQAGHRVDACVADANRSYLHTALEQGLSCRLQNLEHLSLPEQDLLIARALYHYNDSSAQRAITESIYRVLKPGGYFVHQLSSGSEANCRLRSDIINLPSLERAGVTKKYSWITPETHFEQLRAVGFQSIEIVGKAPGCSWSPEEQWERFHGKKHHFAETREDDEERRYLQKKRDLFLSQARTLIEKSLIDHPELHENDIERTSDGSFRIHYSYPIIVARK